MNHKRASQILNGAFPLALMLCADTRDAQSNLILRAGGTTLEVDGGSGAIHQIQDP